MIANSAKIIHGTDRYHKGPPLAWRVEEGFPRKGGLRLKLNNEDEEDLAM